MKFVVLVSAFLLPVVSLVLDPSPLLADDGRDLPFLLKRYDGPAPAYPPSSSQWKAPHRPAHSPSRGSLIRKALNGLVERQQCRAAGYVPAWCYPVFPGGLRLWPGYCCPAGSFVCAGSCKGRLLVSSPFSSAHTQAVLQAAQMP